MRDNMEIGNGGSQTIDNDGNYDDELSDAMSYRPDKVQIRKNQMELILLQMEQMADETQNKFAQINSIIIEFEAEITRLKSISTRKDTNSEMIDALKSNIDYLKTRQKKSIDDNNELTHKVKQIISAMNNNKKTYEEKFSDIEKNFVETKKENTELKKEINDLMKERDKVIDNLKELMKSQSKTIIALNDKITKIKENNVSSTLPNQPYAPIIKSIPRPPIKQQPIPQKPTTMPPAKVFSKQFFDNIKTYISSVFNKKGGSP